MFSVGLRYTLVRSVSAKSTIASSCRHALRPTFSAYATSRSFVATAGNLKEKEGVKKNVVKKPATKAEVAGKKTQAVAKKEAKEKTKPKKKDREEAKETKTETEKQKEAKAAKEKEAKIARAIARKEKVKARKEREKARILKRTANEKARKLKAKERARERAIKEKELNKVKAFKALTRTTRPPFKKPLNAYQNFMKAELLLSNKEPGAYRQWFTQAAAKWSTLTTEEKESYESEGLEAAMDEYKTKYSEWKKALGKQQRKAFSARQGKGTVRINTYSIFSKEHFPKNLNGKSFAEASKEISVAFTALSDAEKEVYAQRALDLRAQREAEEKQTSAV